MEEDDDGPQSTLDHQGCQQGLKGLPNLGNTCYINSALQALSHIKPLRLFFTQTYFRRLRLQWDNSIDSLFCRFITAIWSQQQRPGEGSNPTETMVALRALVSFTWKRYSFFNPGDQHDSQEFLQCLLGDLHESLKFPFDPEACFHNGGESPEPLDGYQDIGATLRELAHELLQDQSGAGSDYSDKLDRFIRLAEDFSEHRLRELVQNDGDDAPSKMVDSETLAKSKSVKFRSIISDLFAGELENTIRCANCSKTSVLNETFMSLSIPIGAIDRAIQSKFLQNSINFQSVHRSVPFKSSSSVEQDDERSPPSPSSSSSSSSEEIPYNTLMSRSYRFAMEAFRYYYKYMWSWFDWFLSFLSTSSVDLIDCLETFFNPELLENENRYHCGNCKKLCNGIKCIRIKRLPEILVVHLNRYQNVNSMVRKITSQLHFPLVDFSLSSFLSESAKSSQSGAVYDLVAVICHNGSQVTNGHYICYALNDLKMEWYEFDDVHVSFVDRDRIISMASSAYILFYQRHDQDSVADRAIQVIYDMERRWIDQCRDYKFLERLNFSDYYYFSSPVAVASRPTILDEAHVNLKSFLLSKYWSNAFLSLQNPGHIDNTDILCPHALIRPTEYLFFNKLSISVIEPVGRFLWAIYDGGPLFHCGPRRLHPVCPECTRQLDLLDQRRRTEYQTFSRLQNTSHTMFRKLKFEKGQLSITFEKGPGHLHCQEQLSSNYLEFSKTNPVIGENDDDVHQDDDEEDGADDQFSQMKIVELAASSSEENNEPSLFYVISTEWMIKWFSFVMIRFDSATVTSRDRQLASLLEQILKKRDGMTVDSTSDESRRRPYDHIYRKPLIGPTDPRIVHPPLVSLLRSITNTMTKNQCVVDPEELIKQVDLGLHTVRPPGPIDNWSFFGIKQKVLAENRARRKERSSSQKTIDSVDNYDELCSLFAEMLSGEPVKNDGEDGGTGDGTNQCDYKFTFHSRMGGGYEENNCCVFYFMAPEFWRFFHGIYTGGPTITFNCSLNRFEALVTRQDIEYFMRQHYKSGGEDPDDAGAANGDDNPNEETCTVEQQQKQSQPKTNHHGDDGGNVLRHRRRTKVPKLRRQSSSSSAEPDET